MIKNPKAQLIRRHARVRAKVRGVVSRPRLSVSRSTKHIQAQLIDDEKGVTIFGVSDIKVKKGTKQERAAHVGAEVAKKALEKGIKKIVFDRGGRRYHGRVKALADAAREAGLEF